MFKHTKHTDHSNHSIYLYLSLSIYLSIYLSQICKKFALLLILFQWKRNNGVDEKEDEDVFLNKGDEEFAVLSEEEKNELENNAK